LPRTSPRARVGWRIGVRRRSSIVTAGSRWHGSARTCWRAVAGDAWVVERLRDGAREALERGAPNVAADYAGRAARHQTSADQAKPPARRILARI
jgi:hypothetical protein